MKTLLLVLITLFAQVGKAEEIQRDATRNNSGIRNEYDDLMKNSGKWEFLGNTCYVLGALSAATSVYAWQRGQVYREEAKQHTLSLHDQSELKKWQDLTDATGYGAAGLIGVGLFGTLMEIRYENRAHEFALDMKVNF